MRAPHRISCGILAVVTAFAFSGCSRNDPLNDKNTGTKDTIVIGSQDYYSNEIIAEIYAQALEKSNLRVSRQFRIGQREAYLPEIEKGSIDLFPEYTGPLLQYWKSGTKERLPDAVYNKLKESIPKNLRVLDQSPATDQDTFVVTKEFAQKWNLVNISDLKNVTIPLTLGANSEAESRPNGPKGLQEKYEIKVAFTPIEDGGGPLTVKALKDGTIQLAIMYTASPSILKNDLVALKDDGGLFFASHVVPLASAKLPQDAIAKINKISAVMSSEELVALNARSVDEKLPPAKIANEWLAKKNLG